MAHRIRGRPKKHVNEDEVRSLLLAGVKKTRIAEKIKINRGTLDTFILEHNLNHLVVRSELSDNEIDDLCRKAKHELPSFGERMIAGYFRAHGVNVTRAKLRASIHRVDPEGVAIRREQTQRTIRRRVYFAPYPHYMWHIDGNHKLIRWRMVIHIGIDGFSRACVYMKCSDNNRALTVLQSFEDALVEFKIPPTRVRSDHGGENLMVWQVMLQHRTDENPHPVIVGSSVHNQRVERFNRDVNRHVRDKYASIFYKLETDGHLHVDNPIDIFCLHYVYMKRINKTLATLRLSHNEHPIRTEANQTPSQLIASSWHLRDNTVALPAPPGQLLDNVDASTTNALSLMCVQNPLNEDNYETLCREVDPLFEDAENGKKVYLATRYFVTTYATTP